MAEYKEGELVLYQNIDRVEIGKIKRPTDDGAFVWYHEGETAAKTSLDCLHKIQNGYVIKTTTLGGGAQILREPDGTLLCGKCGIRLYSPEDQYCHFCGASLGTVEDMHG